MIKSNRPSIKAFLLSAGYGTRLRPLTNEIPKCLVELNSYPLLGYWLDKLCKIDCESVLVNLHYLSSQVERFLSAYSKQSFTSKLKITTVFEPTLLGTAGSLIHNSTFFDADIGLLIHADNWMTEDLSTFIDAHIKRPHNCHLTMLTFETDDPKSCGIVQLNEQGIVSTFYEKSDTFYGTLANAAVYAFDKHFIQILNALEGEYIDFSVDVLPCFLNAIFTYKTSKPFVDVGTLERLNYARSLIQA